MTGEGGEESGELSTGRKLRVLAYCIGAVGVLVVAGVLGFQILSP